jgi:glycosyltransferase involved in cell wall biosynthesis
MRILLLSDNYPPETNAAALRSSAHARRWVERGHEVTVVTSFPNFPEGKLFAGYKQSPWKRETVDGVDVIRVPTLIFPNAGTAKRIADFVSYMVSATIAALFVKRPDIVVATSPQFFAAVAGWMTSVLRWRPFVFELRDLWPDSIIAVGALKDGALLRMVRKLEYFLYRRADLIVSVTNAFRRHLAETGIDPEKIRVVRNGADLSRFSPGPADDLRARLGLRERIVVSYIGTIGMAHGLDMLIEAAARLAVQAPQVRLLMVGSGAERERLKAMAAERQLDNMIFVDRIAHDAVPDYWRVSDMTLVVLKDHPLFRTVIPSKIFEAMATGTPIVTNVKGELEELLTPLGSAVHVEAGNAGALADAVTALANDPARRKALSAAGVAASSQFHRTKQADLMLEALEELAAARDKAAPRR